MNSKKLLRPCINLSKDHPLDFNRKHYKYMYSLKGHEKTSTVLFMKKFSKIKYLHSLEAEFNWIDLYKAPRWFQFCSKSLRYFSSMTDKSYLMRQFLSKIPGTFLKKACITYCAYTTKWTKSIIESINSLLLVLSNSFLETNYKELNKLSRFFTRSHCINKCFLVASGCHALGLNYLAEQLQKVKRDIQFEIFIDFDKLKFQRIEVFGPLKDKMRLCCSLEFTEFKLTMHNTMDQIKSLELSINFGHGKEQLLKLNALARLKNLEEARIAYQFTWAHLKLRDVLDNARYPTSLKKLKLFFLGCFDNNEPYNHDVEMATTYEGLLEAVQKLEDVKPIRIFLKELSKLSELKVFQFHLRHYTKQLPFYYYLFYAIAQKAPKSVHDFHFSMDFDDVFKQREYELSIDVSFLLSQLPSLSTLKKFHLKAALPEFKFVEKLTAIPEIRSFSITPIRDHVKACEKGETRFFKLLCNSKIETLVYPFGCEEIFSLFAEENAFIYLTQLQIAAKYKIEIDEETCGKFISSLKGKHYLKTLVIYPFMMELEAFEKWFDVLEHSKLQKIYLGTKSFGVGRDGYLDDITLRINSWKPGTLNIFNEDFNIFT